MSPPTCTEGWIHCKDAGDGGETTRVKLVDFGNYVMVFLLQGPLDRIASWVEAKRTLDALSGQVDVNINVLFGDRDDIWTRVIARRAVDAVGKDVMLAVSLSKECKNEQGVKEVSKVVVDLLKQFINASQQNA